jgi:predicted transcriptional regulator of viral defense system
MNAAEALGRLRSLRVPVVTTSDAAAALGLRIDAASQTLRRLGRSGLVFPLRRGLWAVDALPDRLLLAEYVTVPYPAYVSLQSALYLRGMIEAIPQVIYVVSLGRTASVRVAGTAVSVHHVPPELFGGFDRDERTGVKVASAEKALFDMAYLSGTRTRLFRSVPEIVVPRGFKVADARSWVGQIRSARLRTLTANRLGALVGHVVGSSTATAPGG